MVRLSAEAVDAIDQARRNGLKIVLVTGRIGAELEAEFAGSPFGSPRCRIRMGR